MVQKRTGPLCVSGGPGGAGVLLSHLFPRGCKFPFTFIDRYPIPLLKRHRNARPSHQHLLDSGHASVSCLWNLILSLKCLYKLSQLWTNSCQTISAVPHLCLACVGRACFELKKKKKGGGVWLFHFVWQLLNGRFPFPLHFFLMLRGYGLAVTWSLATSAKAA